MIVFAISIAAVMVFYGQEFKGDFLTEWKFGFSSAVTILALLAASYHNAKQRYKICAFTFFVLAALNLLFAFRSQMVIILVAGALTTPIFENRRPLNRRQIRPKASNFRALILLALAGWAIFIANQAIKLAATQGLLDGQRSWRRVVKRILKGSVASTMASCLVGNLFEPGIDLRSLGT